MNHEFTLTISEVNEYTRDQEAIDRYIDMSKKPVRLQHFLHICDSRDMNDAARSKATFRGISRETYIRASWPVE